MIHQVEIFLGPMACACSGLVDLKAEEKHTRAEMIARALREMPDTVGLVVLRADDEDAYPEFFKRLSALLREAGEEEFAERVGFSIRYVTPAIAVDGALRCFGQVPDVKEFLSEL
jgi:hypothetical protein